jgi:hypothetical protein
MLGDDTYRGRQVWKIEMIPTASRRHRSFYGRIVSYVDKERYIVLKQDLYDRSGRFYKQLSVLEVKQYGRIWLPRKAMMNNLIKRRVTTWERTRVAYDVEIDKEFLTQRSLTDFAYRERQMQHYRQYLTDAENESHPASAKE